ncbi:MAG: tripartite tricarboxylate transporter substrate binding protein [Burkholderiales bacterium]|nr:tripartite tricarboxylate transporter substrate binding protein [Burkholderiales bacterium]
MLKRKRLLCCIGVIAALGAGAGGAAAQNFPVKPIRMIVGFPPGGVVDLVARTTAQPAGEILGQQIVVDARPGANGMIGAELITKAPSNGYTIGLVSISNMLLSVLLNPSAPYHTLRDFTPITNVGLVPFVVAVHPAVPARSLKELIALAGKQPGKLNFGSPGIGGLQHLTIEMINSSSGVSIQHVPYKGTGPAMTDVLGGQIDGVIAGISGMVGASKSGKLRILAITSEERSAALPEVPTAKEQGLPDLVVVNWYAIVGPPRLPEQTLAALHGAIVKAVNLPATREKFEAAGVGVKTDATPAAFAQYVRDEFARWDKTVKQAGVKLE